MSLQEDAKRILPFVQAMAEGKTVQVMIGNNWIDKESATFDSVWILRIKPDKKWRPYTRDEMPEHIGRVIRLKSSEFVWHVITTIDSLGGIHMPPYGRVITGDELLENYLFVDSLTRELTPCGVEVEE